MRKRTCECGRTVYPDDEHYCPTCGRQVRAEKSVAFDAADTTDIVLDVGFDVASSAIGGKSSPGFKSGGGGDFGGGGASGSWDDAADLHKVIPAVAIADSSSNILDGVGSIFSDAGDTISSVAESCGDVLEACADGVGSAIGGVAEAAVEILSSIGDL